MFLKLLSWNCNGALRRKFEFLQEFNADIHIIQECENPAETNNQRYKEWARNHLWIGDNKNKGLGIFAKPEVLLKPLDWPNEFNSQKVKYFLPCIVMDRVQIVGVWTHFNNSPNFGYVGQLWKYLQVNIHKLNSCIVAGDFNSNSIWDEWDRWWNHSDVVRQLHEIGVRSIYHNLLGENHGKESTPTFYLQKNLDKCYHIDYCFASADLMKKVESFAVEKFDEWKHLSDHCPLSVTISV